MMPQQDNIGGQKADEDTHTDRKVLWQQPVTSIQKKQVGTGGHQFQWADRNDQSRQDVRTYLPIGKRQDQRYPLSTPCDPRITSRPGQYRARSTPAVSRRTTDQAMYPFVERWRTIGLRSYARISGPAARVDAVSARKAKVRIPTEAMKDFDCLGGTGFIGFTQRLPILSFRIYEPVRCARTVP